MWGSLGNRFDQFQLPWSVAVDRKANLFVVDTYNNRIQMFQLTNPCPSNTKQVVIGVCFTTKWGSYGTGNGQFKLPQGIGVDYTGNVFVGDSGNDRVQMFKLANPCPAGTVQIVSEVCFVTSWGGFGIGKGYFNDPRGIAADYSGYVYVADTNNERIQKFQITDPCPIGSQLVVPGVCFVKEWGSHGSGIGQFKGPWDVDVDYKGYVYVADLNNHRIQKFQLTSFCLPGRPLVVPGVCFVKEWGSHGLGFGQFDNPYGVAVDFNSSVFVTDTFHPRIEMFQLINRCPGGTTTQVVHGVCLSDEFGPFGVSLGQTLWPHGLDVDSSGSMVFVADTFNNRIQIFADDTKPEIGRFKP
jgi:tripartite motif-containing protein 71